MTIYEINIDGRPYQLSLNESLASKELIKRLPLQLELQDYNSNEKVVSLNKSLPQDARAVNRITAGDFMLYRDRSLVLFYKNFDTPYTYTPLGRMEGDLNRLNHRKPVHLEWD